MTRILSEYFNPWEHCPDCGALLLTAPGSLYCSHCGFEEAVFEGPVRMHQPVARDYGRLSLEAGPDTANDEFLLPLSEAA